MNVRSAGASITFPCSSRVPLGLACFATERFRGAAAHEPHLACIVDLELDCNATAHGRLLWFDVHGAGRGDRLWWCDDGFDEVVIGKRLAQRLPLLEARRGNELIERGGIEGKIVLLAS